MAFSPLPIVDFNRNPLDVSPLTDAINNRTNVQFKRNALDMDQQRLDMAKGQDARDAEFHPIKIQSAKQQMDLAADEAEQKKQERVALQLAKVGEMISTETDPAKQKALLDKVMASHPRFAEATKRAGMPPEIANDPVVWSRYWGALASPYRDALTRRVMTAEAEAKEAAAATGKFIPLNENAQGVFDTRNRTVIPAGSGIDRTARIVATEAAKKEGEAIGAARAGLPEALRSGETMIRQIDELIGNPKLGISGDPNLNAVIGPLDARLPTIRGRSQATEARIGQITGGTFLQAFAALRGGGAITEKEGEKATAAFNRLSNLRQDERSYRAAATEFRDEVVKLMDIARQRASVPGQRAPDQGGTARVNSDEDYDRLPSGRQFIGPDGQMRIKP